jgi:hypothetical protein
MRALSFAGYDPNRTPAVHCRKERECSSQRYNPRKRAFWRIEIIQPGDIWAEHEPFICRSARGCQSRGPHQPMRWLVRLKIAASRLYGPAPAKMTTINMTAYKISGR